MKNKVSMAAVVLAISLLHCMAVFGQDKKALSLKDAIDLSLKNSKQLKGSAARIEQATAVLKDAVQQRLPSASASASYLRVNNPNVSLKVKSNNSNNGNGNTQSSTPQVSQAAYGLVNLSLPIYAGSRIRYGIESAKYLEQAEKLDAENDREAVIYNTIDAYNNLFKSKAALDLVNESLQQSKQRVKEFSNLEANGLLARNDLLKAELQSSNTELSLLDAENNWKLANLNMNLMLGLPDSTQLVIDSSSLQNAATLESLDVYVQTSLQNRKDLSALDYRKRAAITNVKALEGEKYPSIALTGGYVALDIPQLVTVTNAVNIGVGLQYNIASLWKNGKQQQAKARVKEVNANQDAAIDAIHLQVNQAYQNYLLSQKKIDVYATAVAQATENYKIVKNKYDNGLETVTNLLDADVAQLQARLNFAFAKSDAAVSYYRLLQTTGTLNNQ